MAFQRLAHPDGEIATAPRGRGDRHDHVPVDARHDERPGARRRPCPTRPAGFSCTCSRDRGVTRELIAQAVEHGYEALVVTVDLPVVGVRERELRPGVRSASAADLVAHARALGAAGRRARRPGRARPGGLLDADLSWSDIEQFAAESPLPVVVKGILTPRTRSSPPSTAPAAIVVSNHGGRQLDTVLAGADALPAVVDAVGDRLEVIVDGGDPPRHRRAQGARARGARGDGRPPGRCGGWRSTAPPARSGCSRSCSPSSTRARARRRAAGLGARSELRRAGAVARPAAVNILVTGITGYVGSRLAPRLRRDGHEVRGFARRPASRLVGSRTSTRRRGHRRAGSSEALDGIDVAYFLIHSMERRADGGVRGPRARRPPRTSPAPPRAAGVSAIIYLGGLDARRRRGVRAPRQPARGRARSCWRRLRARWRSGPRS